MSATIKRVPSDLRRRAADQLDSAQRSAQTLVYLLKCLELNAVEFRTENPDDPQSAAQCKFVLLDALDDQHARAAKAFDALRDGSDA